MRPPAGPAPPARGPRWAGAAVAIGRFGIRPQIGASASGRFSEARAARPSRPRRSRVPAGPGGRRHAIARALRCFAPGGPPHRGPRVRRGSWPRGAEPGARFCDFSRHSIRFPLSHPSASLFHPPERHGALACFPGAGFLRNGSEAPLMEPALSGAGRRSASAAKLRGARLLKAGKAKMDSIPGYAGAGVASRRLTRESIPFWFRQGPDLTSRLPHRQCVRYCGRQVADLV
jgi:hypothetical protein